MKRKYRPAPRLRWLFCCPYPKRYCPSNTKRWRSRPHRSFFVPLSPLHILACQPHRDLSWAHRLAYSSKTDSRCSAFLCFSTLGVIFSFLSHRPTGPRHDRCVNAPYFCKLYTSVPPHAPRIEHRAQINTLHADPFCDFDRARFAAKRRCVFCDLPRMLS